MPDNAAVDRLTPQQIDHQLRRLFASVDEWQQLWDRGALAGPVHRGSSLAGDDRKSQPYQVSHGVEQMVGIAVDHLHALRVLLLDAGVLHTSAPFTLARSAIEAGATALWILQPPSRAERITRRLRHVAQDARDGDAVARDMSGTPPRSLQERLQDIHRVGAVAAGRAITLSPLSITKAMTYVDGLPNSHMSRLAAWKVCSGFAHGRLWSTLSVLDQETFPGATEETATLRITNSLDRVLWTVWVAHDLVRDTLHLFRQRAASPHDVHDHVGWS